MRISRQRCLGWTWFRIYRVRRMDDALGWVIHIGRRQWTVFGT